MEFGILFTSHPNTVTEPYPHRDVHARVTREILRADELGYDYAWVAEHHFSNEYGIMPDVFIYAAYLAALTAIFVVLYANLTPQRDIALIRGGNSAAALALVGALLGFEVPLASVIAHSAAILDLAVWGIVALVVQLVGFLVVRMVLPGHTRLSTSGRSGRTALSARRSTCSARGAGCASTSRGPSRRSSSSSRG